MAKKRSKPATKAKGKKAQAAKKPAKKTVKSTKSKTKAKTAAPKKKPQPPKPPTRALAPPRNLGPTPRVAAMLPPVPPPPPHPAPPPSPPDELALDWEDQARESSAEADLEETGAEGESDV